MSEEKQVAERTSKAEVDFLGKQFFYTIEEVAKEDFMKVGLNLTYPLQNVIIFVSLSKPNPNGPQLCQHP